MVFGFAILFIGYYICARDWITCGDPDTPTRGFTKTSSRFAWLGFSFCSLSKASFARFQNEKTFSIKSRRFLCPGLDFLRTLRVLSVGLPTVIQILPRGAVQKNLLVPLRGPRVFAFIRFSKQAWNAHKCKNPSSSMRGFVPGTGFLSSWDSISISSVCQIWVMNIHFFTLLFVFKSKLHLQLVYRIKTEL